MNVRQEVCPDSVFKLVFLNLLTKGYVTVCIIPKV